MPTDPKITFHLPDSKQPVTPDHPLWDIPIPVTRESFVTSKPRNHGIEISHAEYFLAAQAFFQEGQYGHIRNALAMIRQQAQVADEIDAVRITLSKHGAFYHPARVEVLSQGGRSTAFVLNVAVTESGIKTIRTEYECLRRLNSERPSDDLPRVFARGQVTSSGGNAIHMFLGEWFDSYSEFHLSIDPSDRYQKVIVWDAETGHPFLTPEQELALYTRAARVMTHYYNLESFEQIFPWHMAAGDFVIKPGETDVDLKLITVRGYKPIFKDPQNLDISDKTPHTILEALLLFVLSLSIRLRLDRLDGVGEIVWADDLALHGTLAGCMQGLAQHPPIPSLPETPARCLAYYLQSCSRTDLTNRSRAILRTYHPQSPEINVISTHLSDHIDALLGAINLL